jgi:release factor glutamine methyltransferase
MAPPPNVDSVTWGSLVRSAAARLACASDSAVLDARVLLAHAAGVSTSPLPGRDREPVGDAVRTHFEAMVAARAGGVPVAYLTGRREFWSLDLEVGRDVLIPRPETELLVEVALERIVPGRPWAVADLGTGSGAVAAAIGAERQAALVIASDRSAAALRLAARNVARLGLSNVRLAAADWLTAFAPASFDVVLANPPYVAAGDPHLERGDVRFEPRTALAAGRDGLDALRVIIAGSPPALKPGGMLAVEHGADQGSAVRALMRAAGLREAHSRRDLAGHERVTLAVL